MSYSRQRVEQVEAGLVYTGYWSKRAVALERKGKQRFKTLQEKRGDKVLSWLFEISKG
jgi:hypothetical protein